MSIGWIIFWKCVVLTAWETAKELRAKRRDRLRADLFYQEWRRRTAKHPLALPDLRAERPE